MRLPLYLSLTLGKRYRLLVRLRFQPSNLFLAPYLAH